MLRVQSADQRKSRGREAASRAGGSGVRTLAQRQCQCRMQNKAKLRMKVKRTDGSMDCCGQHVTQNVGRE